MPFLTKRVLLAAFCRRRAVCTPPETQPIEPSAANPEETIKTFQDITDSLDTLQNELEQRARKSPSTPQPLPEETGWERTLIDSMNCLITSAIHSPGSPSPDIWCDFVAPLKKTLIEEETTRMKREIEELEKSQQDKMNLEKEKTELHLERTKLKNEKDELEKRFADLLQTHKQAADERDRLQEANQKQSELVGSLKKSKTDLEAANRSLEANQTQTADVVNAKNKRVEELEGVLESSAEKVNKCEKEKSELRDQLEQSKRWTLFG